MNAENIKTSIQTITPQPAMKTSIDIKQSRLLGKFSYKLCIKLARDWHHDSINGTYPSKMTCRNYRDKYLAMARILSAKEIQQ